MQEKRNNILGSRMEEKEKNLGREREREKEKKKKKKEIGLRKMKLPCWR